MFWFKRLLSDIHVEILKSPRGYFSFFTWGFENFHVEIDTF